MLERLPLDEGDYSRDYNDDHDNDDGEDNPKESNSVRSDFSPDGSFTVDGVGGFILL